MIEDDPLLGAFVAAHPSDRLRPLLVAGTVCGAVGLVLTFTLASSDNGWGPALSAVIMALVALGAGWYVLNLWNREVILYSRGFTVREGSRIVPLLYDEIKSLRQNAERLAYFGGLARRSVYRLTLTTIRDETLVLSNVYRRPDALADTLERLVNRAMWPRVEEQIEAGEWIAVAPGLQIGRDGLRRDDDLLLWEALGGYRVEQGQLALLDAAGAVWASVPLAAVDNVTLVLALIKKRQQEVAPTPEGEKEGDPEQGEPRPYESHPPVAEQSRTHEA